jgi:hypothetical protein
MQSAFEVGRRWFSRPVRRRNREDAETFAGEGLGPGCSLADRCIIADDDRWRQHGLWRALADDSHAAVWQPVHGSHSFPAAVERQLRDTWKPLLQFARIQAKFGCDGQQCCLGGIANRGPLLLLPGRRPDSCIVAQGGCGQQLGQVRRVLLAQSPASADHLAGGVVARAADLGVALCRP